MTKRDNFLLHLINEYKCDVSCLFLCGGMIVIDASFLDSDMRNLRSCVILSLSVTDLTLTFTMIITVPSILALIFHLDAELVRCTRWRATTSSTGTCSSNPWPAVRQPGAGTPWTSARDVRRAV